VGWVRVCPVAELSETTARQFRHDGRVLCVALAEGRPRAIDDACPHREAALSGGLVRDGVVTCPGHFRRFDLRTGACLDQPADSVTSYPCTITDGWVEVSLGAPPRPRSLREILLAHAADARLEPGP
jgi:nitrite reductase/ring-hydroxylating ferredoxin subunit